MRDPPTLMSTSTKPRIESKLQPLSFEALTPDGSNFLEWNNDAKTYLAAAELDKALNSGTAAELSSASKWQALLLLR